MSPACRITKVMASHIIAAWDMSHCSLCMLDGLERSSQSQVLPSIDFVSWIASVRTTANVWDDWIEVLNLIDEFDKRYLVLGWCHEPDKRKRFVKSSCYSSDEWCVETPTSKTDILQWLSVNRPPVLYCSTQVADGVLRKAAKSAEVAVWLNNICSL